MDFLTVLYGIFIVCGAITIIAAIVCVTLKRKAHICSKCAKYGMTDSMHECYLSLYEFMKSIELNLSDSVFEKVGYDLSGRDKDGNLIKFYLSDELSTSIYEYDKMNKILSLYRNRFSQDMAVYGAKVVKNQLDNSGFVIISQYGVGDNRFWKCKNFKYK